VHVEDPDVDLDVVGQLGELVAAPTCERTSAATSITGCG